MLSKEVLQERFVRECLPIVHRMGKVRWGHWRDANDREDCQGEATGQAWREWLRYHRLGRDLWASAATIARYAVKWAARGNHVAGGKVKSELLAPGSPMRTAGRVLSLLEANGAGLASECVQPWQDRRGCEPWQLAVVNLDFVAFVAGLADRERRLVQLRQDGHSPGAIAAHWHVCPDWVKIKLRRLWREWMRFAGNEEACKSQAGRNGW